MGGKTIKQYGLDSYRIFHIDYFAFFVNKLTVF